MVFVLLHAKRYLPKIPNLSCWHLFIILLMTKPKELKEDIIVFKSEGGIKLGGEQKLFAKYKLISFELLVKANWNYKVDNDDLKSKLIENLKRNGQVVNTLVRELDTGYFEVIDGNHRYDAFEDMKVDYVLCFGFGRISDAKAKRIAVEINETRFESDNIKLAETIKDITTEFPLEELEISMPFSLEELENFDNLLEFDSSAKGENPPKHVCPKCGYEF